ncbi:hypothetical protein [Pelomonas sp. SE-A7]|uniref:hypothetical protein n=1 Tax=Pelomonas sp. SE-A7 TaxID=3054953 RepID=UPI00259CC72E|nr:hypothetical protein [Pelomonas sp. SE-A7]MDM4765399.1 hypothetical protein [Pelomonas sp. SE-A7]
MPESPSPSMLDPFGEQRATPLRRCLDLLGCSIEFLGDSPELFELVDAAYAGLPALQLDQAPADLSIRLSLREGAPLPQLPPEPTMQGGPGLLCALVDADNHTLVVPAQRQALVTISRGMLAHAYNARYELLEFAVFTLAARVRGLVPLHAACVGTEGRGLLLLGRSGAGKSMLALHAMREGLDFLTEDASFITPGDLRLVGIPNFLHLRDDALALIDDAELLAQVRAAPRISRRSGVEKQELDLRRTSGPLATKPLRLCGLVFVDGSPCDEGPALRPLAAGSWSEALAQSQPYARGQAGWSEFLQQLSHVPAYALKRRGPPRESAKRLRELLAQASPSP